MIGPSDGFGALIQASREEVQDKSPVKTREASQLAKGQPRQMDSRTRDSTHAPGACPRAVQQVAASDLSSYEFLVATLLLSCCTTSAVSRQGG